MHSPKEPGQLEGQAVPTEASKSLPFISFPLVKGYLQHRAGNCSGSPQELSLLGGRYSWTVYLSKGHMVDLERERPAQTKKTSKIRGHFRCNLKDGMNLCSNGSYLVFLPLLWPFYNPSRQLPENLFSYLLYTMFFVDFTQQPRSRNNPSIPLWMNG